jgi:hypothetical protein
LGFSNESHFGTASIFGASAGKPADHRIQLARCNRRRTRSEKLRNRVCVPSQYAAARDDRDQESQACPSSCNGDKVISVTVAPIRSDIVEKVSAAAAAKLPHGDQSG